MSDDFVRDLELALVAAARKRATRGRGRALPRPRALVLAVAVALACAALLAVLGRGEPDTAGDERSVPPPSPPAAVATLAPLLPPERCRNIEVREEPAAPALAGTLGVLERPERGDDSALPPPSGFDEDGRATVWLPVATFDPREVRLAGGDRLRTMLRVVPTLGAATDGGCRSADEPGACLVDGRIAWRCFTVADIRAGRALARTEDGTAIGLVPDGVAAVTLSAAGASVSAEVVENVYEAPVNVPAGARVEIRFDRAGDCRRGLAPELVDRVEALRTISPDRPLPLAARELMRDWEWQLDAVVDSEARIWGGGDGVEFWLVPVVPSGHATCAPATGLCVVLVSGDGKTDSQCSWGRQLREGGWKIGPVWDDRVAVLGIVDDSDAALRITMGGRTGVVDASGNVAAGTLPFPYRDGMGVRVEYLPAPVVGIVDAGGDVKRALRALVGADAVEPIGDAERTPRPIQKTHAPLVVVVGSG